MADLSARDVETVSIWVSMTSLNKYNISVILGHGSILGALSILIRANFVFSIYDFEGNGTVDAVNIGDMLRALNQNPTLATVEKLGGTKKKNEKKLKVEEFLPIYSQVKKDKEQGGFEDFLECLKLYDKEENGTMMAAELAHTLLSLGERLADAECDELLADCMPKEDDEGFIPYEPFLKAMMA